MKRFAYWLFRAAMITLVAPLKAACDRDWKDETPEQVVSIAANAIYWRGRDEACQILQDALDWDAEYRAINNLGKNGPYWTWRAKQKLEMIGRYAPPAAPRGEGTR